jgi:sugar phosphate isomerase/epimerase
MSRVPNTVRWSLTARSELVYFAECVATGREPETAPAFTKTAADQLRMLEEFAHPALGHLLDTGNYVDGWPSVERTAHLAVHVHAKFWGVAANRAEPTIDYPRLVEMLRRRGYGGWLSFEYEAAAEATGIPRALGYLRRLVESPASATA